MQSWFQTNSIFGTCFLVLSMSNIDVLALLYSEVFSSHEKGSLFNAPISTQTVRQLFWLGILGNFLEDIPQFGVQVVCVYVCMCVCVDVLMC